MPQPPATPGVYINEIAAQNRPIQGVGTSVAAFVGMAPAGPANTPVRITSWSSFARTFGDPIDTKSGPFMAGAYLAHAVYGFFHNGGGDCWVIRVGEDTYGNAPQIKLLSAAPATDDDPAPEVFRIVASAAAVTAGQQVSVTLTQDEPPEPAASKSKTGVGGDGADAQPPAPSPTYTLEVSAAGSDDPPEKFERLTPTPGPNYLAAVVNAASKLVQVKEAVAPIPTAKRAPAPLETTVLAAPDPASETPPSANDLSGNENLRSGLTGLAPDEVNMICIPDLMALAKSDGEIRAVQEALSDFCQEHKCMAILDPPPGLVPQDVADWREAAPSNPFTTLYWPWIQVASPVDGQLIDVPPSGHIAGLWARVDEERGVFKAPANEELRGAIGLAFNANKADQGILNPLGINCIRSFPGAGIRVWGARTLELEDGEWRYLNVRRLFNYVTASIANGTTWAVFEPNDEALWTSLRISVTNFLTTVWRGGALFGASPGEAFFVKCDSETNPQDLIDMGQVNVQVGIAPVKPAEFVIFQVSQYQIPAA